MLGVRLISVRSVAENNSPAGRALFVYDGGWQQRLSSRRSNENVHRVSSKRCSGVSIGSRCHFLTTSPKRLGGAAHGRQTCFPFFGSSCLRVDGQDGSISRHPFRILRRRIRQHRGQYGVLPQVLEDDLVVGVPVGVVRGVLVVGLQSEGWSTRA